MGRTVKEDIGRQRVKGNILVRIIWVVNVVFPDIGNATISNINVTWLETMLSELAKQERMVVCCPTVSSKQIVKAENNSVIYYGVPRKDKRGFSYEPKMKEFFKKIFKDERPDIVHIWGTEFPHTLSAVLAADELGILDRTVISIQGLVSVIAKHFMGNVPLRWKYVMVPKNFFRGFNLAMTQSVYKKRGKYECEAIKRVYHVIGRTDWDKACTKQINSNVIYHKNNETLRKCFYENRWDYKDCIPYRIFMSQGGSPMKGAHNLIEAMRVVQKDYPEVHLYITGKNILGKLTVRQMLSLDPYDWYLRKKIYKYDLQKKITFMGSLSAEEMRDQYLKANVFVLPSAIENSPNSLGEAMLLGTPSVAADVGGVKNLMEHEKEGYIYQHDAPYMLAYYIMEIFRENKKMLEHRSERAREHAWKLYSVEENKKDLVQIYNQLSGERKRG